MLSVLKKICISSGLLLLFVFAITSVSLAANDAPGLSPSFNWNGFYGGVQFGYGWGQADTELTPLPTATQFYNLAPTTERLKPKGGLGGIAAGYNYQINNLVLGGELDFSLSDMHATKHISPIIQIDRTPLNGTITIKQRTDWFGTARLRLGVAPVPNVMLYGTGGLAFARVRYSANADFRPAGTIQYPTSFRKTKFGWTVGAGAEYAFNNKWSVKTEYKYYDLGNESKIANPSPPNPPFQVGYAWMNTGHMITMGVNYRF